jgi:hypothetical protein
MMMKFVSITDGELIAKGVPLSALEGRLTWVCNIKPYSYVISFRKEDGGYHAKWKNQVLDGPAIRVNAWTKPLASFEEAVEACKKQHRILTGH